MKNRKILPKVLYIGDRWCSGDIRLGISEWETNLWKSLKSTGLVNLKTFHFDDYYYRFKKLGDDTLIKKISRYHPDILCLIVYRIPGSDFNVPKWETLETIKYHFKIPIITIWSDLEYTEQVKILQTLLPYTTINAATATSAAIRRINNSKKCVYVWYPKNPEIFNNPGKQRSIDISYLGSTKNGRLNYINYLTKNNVLLFNGGGEREKHLTTIKYANIYKRSKIALSFSRARSHVINARPFEAMNCGAMVLEQESFEMPKLFIPFVDYVPYTNKKDLLEKARYYLKHDKEREIIARNGYKKVTSLYSAKRFWQLLIGRALKTSSGNINNLLFLKPSNLSRLNGWSRLKLRFLDSICSNNLGFRVYETIYIAFDPEYWKSLAFKLLNLIKLFLKKHLPHNKYKIILKVVKSRFHLE